MESEERKVIIVGGGISGLVLAICLERLGIPVAVYDKVQTILAAGSGMSLIGHSMYILKMLGLDVRDIGLVQTDVSLRSHTSEKLFQVPLKSDNEIADMFGSVQVNVHRGELQTALLKLYKGKIFTGFSMERYEEDAKGVIVYFKNGETARGAILVGADGAHSPVRRCMHPHHKLRYSGYTCWRGLTSSQKLDNPQILPQGWMFKTVVHSKNGMSFTAGTLSQGRRFWAFDVKYPERSPDPANVKEFLLSWLNDAEPTFRTIIEETNPVDIIKTDIYDSNPLPYYATKRVVLIGDAAHPMVHHFGQGSCLAIEDAVRLAQHLSTCSPDYSKALERYSRPLETFRAAVLVRISRLCGDFYLGSSPVVNRILRLAFLWPFCLVFVYIMRFLLFILNSDLRDFSKSLAQGQRK